MGLLTTYNDTNKVTDSALRVQYAVESDKCAYRGWIDAPMPDGGTVQVWVDGEKWFYRVHRYATKSYSYVGMDEATAKACQNAKIAQYTRAFSRVVEGDAPPDPEVSPDPSTTLTLGYTYECRSDIVAQHVDGHMWEVVINVNEDDEKFSYELPSNPASLFTAENQRNYDE